MNQRQLAAIVAFVAAGSSSLRLCWPALAFQATPLNHHPRMLHPASRQAFQLIFQPRRINKRYLGEGVDFKCQLFVDRKKIEPSERKNFHVLAAARVMKDDDAEKEDVSSGGKGIIMILSPAKTLDLRPFDPPKSTSFPICTSPSCDAEKTKLLASTLKSKSEKDLGKLLSISSKIAETTYKYYQGFELNPGKRMLPNMKPAIFAFSGAAYQGLQVSSCAEESIRYMQTNLRIIDALYGLLRPMDAIQPYRLEMATKKVLDIKDMGAAKDLASWWRSSVSAHIGEEIGRRKKARILLNLASDEYSSALDAKALPEGTRYITVVFQQEGRVIAVHAKRARGLMVRYIAENSIENIEEIKRFNLEGYAYVEERSSDNSLVFDRSKQAPVATSRGASTRPKAKKAAADDKEADKSSGRRNPSKRARKS